MLDRNVTQDRAVEEIEVEGNIESGVMLRNQGAGPFVKEQSHRS